MHEVFEAVARYFSVLGEPTRLRILHALCQKERCVNEVIGITGMAQANVSRHLGLMYQAGLLSRRRDGNQIFYRVADPVHVDLCRTVSAQVAGRVDEASGSREGGGFTGQAGESSPGSSPSANQKEKASV